MGAKVSQITSLTIVYSTVYLGADQRKYQSPASLTFVRGIHRRPVNSPHKWPVTRKMFPFDNVIMKHTCRKLQIWYQYVLFTKICAKLWKPIWPKFNFYKWTGQISMSNLRTFPLCFLRIMVKSYKFVLLQVRKATSVKKWVNSFLNIWYNSNIAIVRQVRTYMEQLSEQLMHTELERNFVPHMSYHKRLVHSHISVGHLLAVAGLGPVLLQRSVVVASMLANGSAAFSWKLRCHGLRRLLLHHITHVIQVTGMGNRLILLKASRMVYCIKSYLVG